MFINGKKRVKRRARVDNKRLYYSRSMLLLAIQEIFMCYIAIIWERVEERVIGCKVEI
jgi:tRNA(Arg) A34 adenosine deaminase TadA